jgi:hypothetical protein
MTEAHSDKQTLNETLVSPRIAIQPYCGNADVVFDLTQFMNFILAASAYKIYIPSWEITSLSSSWYVSKDLTLDFNDLSNVIKSHIKIIDDDLRVFSKIKAIISEIDEHLNWHDKESNRDLTNALNRIFESLYHLKLAGDYKIECDISRPSDLNAQIELLITNLSNKEDRSFLNEFQGVLNRYQSSKVDCNFFKATENSEISRLIEDFMIDSTFLKLSRERRMLSVTGDLKVIPEIKCLARKLSMTKNYKKLIGLSKLPLKIVPNDLRDIAQDFGQSILSRTKFSPNIVDIDTIFLNFANRNRDIENEPLMPWSVYDGFLPINRYE